MISVTSKVNVNKHSLTPSFPYFLPSWRAVRSYRPHLEERNPIWGDDWSHGPFIRRSPSWGFLGFFSAVRQMSDLCTAPRIISLSPLLLATDVTDETLGASGLWLGTRTGSGGLATLTIFFLAVPYDCMDNRSGLTYDRRMMMMMMMMIIIIIIIIIIKWWRWGWLWWVAVCTRWWL